MKLHGSVAQKVSGICRTLELYRALHSRSPGKEAPGEVLIVKVIFFG